MDSNLGASQSLAQDITRSASKQAYYTIRLLADRGRAANACRAYGYFRWVDDAIDADVESKAEKSTFANRQQALLNACYSGETLGDLCAEERMLVDLVRSDTEKNSGLQAYLRNMMEVMLFDAGRRGQVISQAELAGYSRRLAVAVTEGLYYFIGHDDPSPHHEARYLAVTAAHITHMLRDMLEDVASGYFNIPREYLQAHGISPRDVNSRAYREWVRGRVQLARNLFNAGRECTAQVRNWRCRLAGYAYTARFEWLLRAIERDDYCLRPDYPERKRIGAGVWMGWSALASMLASPPVKPEARRLAARPGRIEER